MPVTEEEVDDKIKLLASHLSRIKEECKVLESQLKQLEVKRKEIKEKEKEKKTNETSSQSSQSSQCQCQHYNSSIKEEWRIIHLKDNPVDQKINKDWEHYQFLKEENKKLSTRLEVIEAGHNADITRMVNDEINHASEIERLKAALQLSESRRKAFIDRFKKTSKELRDAFLSLTGCKITVDTTGYKVSFLYSENTSDYLQFKVENGEVELLETDFSKSLTPFINEYLVQYDSYPAFLAAITLDLFKKANIST